jgi:hypothetical protein
MATLSSAAERLPAKVLAKSNNVMMAKPTPLLSGAGTQKSLGACPQKLGSDKSEHGFCGHPVLLFCRSACQSPGGVGFDAICSLILPELIE